MMAVGKGWPIVALFIGLFAGPPCHAQSAEDETPKASEMPIRAAVRVLGFASYLGGGTFTYYRDHLLRQAPVNIVDDEYAAQQPVDPVVEAIDFIKSTKGSCAYERRDFVPTTSDHNFALPLGLTPDHYAIWHTRVDFAELSDEWYWENDFLRLRGREPICKFITRVNTASLREAISVSEPGAPPVGTSIRCGNTIVGRATGGLRERVIRAVAFMHANICPAYQMPF